MTINKILKKDTIIEIISGLFIILFFYTAISKLWHLDGFESVISKSPLIRGHAHFTARAVPIFELITTVLLIIPKTRKIGLLLSTALMIIFTGYLFYIIYFTPNLPCSCGGVLAAMSWKQHLIFNIFFTALGIVGLLLARNKIDNSKLDSIRASIT